MVFERIQSGINFFIENNNIDQIGLAIAYGIIAFVLLRLLKYFVDRRVKSYLEKIGAKKFEDRIDRIFKSFGFVFYAFLPIYVIYLNLNFPAGFDNFLNPFFLIVILYYAVKVVHFFIEFGIHSSIVKQEKTDKDFDDSLMMFLSFLLKILTWVVAFLLFISNLGFDVTTLIAGLGIGGIAIAFALQNVLSDIFASISIYIDKPFKKGDFIIIGNDMGTVRKIGIKSTRINTLQGQELIVANKELTDSRVNNYKRMRRRRVVFGFGIEYSTSVAKTKNALDIVKKIIDGMDDADLDRVHFKNFGDSSLVYEVVYYVNTSDYLFFMDKQQEINLKIKEEFEKAKIVMAFPTRTIHIVK